jgi:seryl-tRNA(Sec) selenium transferase
MPKNVSKQRGAANRVHVCKELSTRPASSFTRIWDARRFRKKREKRLIEKASGYCNLEYNLETGKRGKRGARAERTFSRIHGRGKRFDRQQLRGGGISGFNGAGRAAKSIISRGELVEIGGDFRVPDVMEQSGATLKEVGATNRTRVSDYEKAISKTRE